jgi:hypothetical protein
MRFSSFFHIPSDFVVDSCLRRRRDSRDFPWIPTGGRQIRHKLTLIISIVEVYH